LNTVECFIARPVNLSRNAEERYGVFTPPKLCLLDAEPKQIPARIAASLVFITFEI
jgi:hypothetical protein